MAEVSMKRTEHGLIPEGEGWFVLNAREAEWQHTERLGSYLPFEGDPRFAQLGINLNWLPPGQPMGMYHAEDAQEDFLALAGECVLIVEGEERPLRAWDLVHCPPMTEHMIVGAGTSPCLVLAVGARRKGKALRYPVNETALRHGAGVAEETDSPATAYAGFGEPTKGACPNGFPGGTLG
jgi:uncharacterized cupin superfamily protein